MPDERPMKHRQDSDMRKYEQDRKRKMTKTHKSSDEEFCVIKSNSKHRNPSEVIEIHGSSSENGEVVSDNQKSDNHNAPKMTHSHRRKHSGHHSKKHKRSHESVDRHSNGDRESRSHRSDSKKKHVKVVENRLDDNLRKSSRERDRNVESNHDHVDKRVARHKTKDGRMQSPNRVKKEEIDEEVKDDNSSRKRERSRDRSRTHGVNPRSIKREDDGGGNSNRSENPNLRRGKNNRQRFNEDTKEYEWGKNKNPEPSVKAEPTEKAKPDFKLSGKLTEDRNTFNGVVIKYSEPPEARMPKKRWRLYQFKGQETLPTLYIHRQSAYLIGRDRKVVDLPIDHPSCSKQHAALQYRLITFERSNGSIGKQIRLYVIDLESANGTYINGEKVETKKYVELMERDVIKFGFSSREYVLLHEQSKDDESDEA